VHRLDAATSGLVLVARNTAAQRYFGSLFARKQNGRKEATIGHACTAESITKLYRVLTYQRPIPAAVATNGGVSPDVNTTATATIMTTSDDGDGDGDNQRDTADATTTTVQITASYPPVRRAASEPPIPADHHHTTYVAYHLQYKKTLGAQVLTKADHPLIQPIFPRISLTTTTTTTTTTATTTTTTRTRTRTRA